MTETNATAARRKPRVLFVNRMASMVRGGGETFDLEMARHLGELGCDVTLLSGIPLFGKAASPVQQMTSEVIRSPYTGWLRWDRTKGGWRVRLADFYMFECRAAAWARARASSFDVIQVCELPLFVERWRRGGGASPVVMRLTAPDYVDRWSSVQNADALIASGDTLAQVREVARPDCIDIPNGVDAEHFRPQASTFRRDHGFSDNEILFLFVARFQNVKNHRMLIHAFKELSDKAPNGRMIFAGSGPLELEMRALARSLGVESKITYLGEVAFEDLPAVYAAVDVKIVASYYESFCFAALEAMATALPIITTDTAWVPELIAREKGGRVVPIDDASAMASAMLELLQNPDARKSLGAVNRERVLSTFAWRRSAQLLLNVYERLMGAASS